MRFPNPRWPRLSLLDLLVLTGVVALGLAASVAPQKDADTPAEGLFAEYAMDLHGVAGLLAAGSLLLAYQLARHALVLAREPSFRESVWRVHRNFAIALRCLLIGAIVGVVVQTIALHYNRAEISHNNDNSASLWTPLWPTLIHFLLAFAAVGLLIAPRKSSSGLARRSRWIAGTVATVGLTTYGSMYLFELHAVTAMVHVATNAIEIAQPSRWHRDAFPHHASENFRTYFSSLAAAGLLALAGTLLVLSWRTPHPRRRRLLRWGFLLPLLGVGIFNAWYYWYELPRISPDIASVPSPLTPWGIAGMAVLALGLALYGNQVAIRLHPHSASATYAIELPLRWPSAWGAILLFAAAVWYLVEAYQVIGAFATMFQDFNDYLHAFSELTSYMLLSDTVVFFLILPITATLLWRSLRRRPLTLTPVPLIWPEVTFNTTATLLLVAVGVPCLHAFGFAMWLGPDWRWG